MPRVRVLALVMTIATLLVLPAAAGAATATARTVYGTVVAPAHATAAGPALPVLMTTRSQRLVGRPVVDVVAPPGAKPVHWGTGSLALQALRPGDVVKVVLRRGARSRIALQRSGQADSFDRVVVQFAALNDAAAKTRSLAGPVSQLTTSSAPRDQVSALRSQLVDFAGDLQNVADDVATSLQRLAEVMPKQDPRRSAVLAAQQPYVDQLNGVRDAAQATLDATNLASDALGPVQIVDSSMDGTANPVDPALPIELPIGTISTVSAVLNAVGTLFDALGMPLTTPTAPGGILDPNGA
jgi:hypothetical protein